MDVSSPSSKCINWSDLSLIWTSCQPITSSSLSSLDCFVQLGGFSTSQMWKEGRFMDWFWRPKISGIRACIDQRWLGVFDQCWLLFWGWNFDFCRPHSLAQILRWLGTVWPSWLLGCLVWPQNYSRLWLGWLSWFWVDFNCLGRLHYSAIDWADWRTFWGSFDHHWLSS